MAAMTAPPEESACRRAVRVPQQARPAALRSRGGPPRRHSRRECRHSLGTGLTPKREEGHNDPPNRTDPDPSAPGRHLLRAGTRLARHNGYRSGDLDEGRQPDRGTVASALQDVAMVPGTSTAWAVGYYYDSGVGAYRSMTQRFNGTSWSIGPSLNASATGYSQLNRVDATSPSNVWALGSDTQAGPLVHKYNGTKWVAMSGPAGVATRGLDVVSTTEVWVAGYSGSAATVTQWKNGTWTTRYTQASTGVTSRCSKQSRSTRRQGLGGRLGS
jgi:hypothetical protein